MDISFTLPSLLQPADLMTLMRHIKESRNIVICGHHAPDGDALGSTLAWQGYLRALGKKANVVMPNAHPDFLRWMPQSQTVKNFRDHYAVARRLIDEADLFFFLDLNEMQRMQALGSYIAQHSRAPRLVVDHHLNPKTEEFDLMVSYPDMSSTSELILRLLIELGAYDDLTPTQATQLYTGIMTDTGCFSYSIADPLTFALAGMLLRKGIDAEEINKNVYHSWSENKLRLWNHILSKNLRTYPEQHTSLYTLTRQTMKDFHFIRGDAEGLVNEPLKVKGMKLSIALREDTEEDVIRVSLRSTGGFQCRDMAEQFFNGGGHANAAGGKLPFPIEEAVKKAEEAIAAYADELKRPAERNIKD